MEKEHPLTELCVAFDVSRSGYYAWRKRKPSARAQANARLLAEIQIIRQGEEPAEFWSQSFCYGELPLPKAATEPVQIRFRNNGGKRNELDGPANHLRQGSGGQEAGHYGTN